jgi:serine/threonine protein kinase
MAKRKSVRKSKRVRRLMSNKRSKRNKRSRINKSKRNRSKRNKRSKINKSKRNKRSRINKSKRSRINKLKIREIQSGGMANIDLFPEEMWVPDGIDFGRLKLVDNQSKPEHKKFGSYELGGGEYGTIYEVESGGVHFAAKISFLTQNDNMSSAFKEINILTNFDCIYLPKAFNASFYINNSHLPWPNGKFSSIIIMEKMDNTLLEYITNGELVKGSTSEKHKYDLLIIGQMVSAVKFLHENSIIHLDLKPANIGIKGQLSMPVIKILEFGLSDHNLGKKDVGCPTKNAAMTNEDEQKVTEPWRSPDIYSGDYNCKSDMWSLGIIILQMMAREKKDSKDRRMKQFLEGGPFKYETTLNHKFGINDYIDDFISFCITTGGENKNHIIEYVEKKKGTNKKSFARFGKGPPSPQAGHVWAAEALRLRQRQHDYKKENGVYLPSNNVPNIQEFFIEFKIEKDEGLFTLALECLKFIPDERISATDFLDRYTTHLRETNIKVLKVLEEYNNAPCQIHSGDMWEVDDLSPYHDEALALADKDEWEISKPLRKRYDELKKKLVSRMEELNLTLNKPGSKINLYIREEKEKDVLFYHKHSSEGKKGESWKTEKDRYRKKRWDKIKQTIQDDDTTFYQKHSSEGSEGKLWEEESDKERKGRWEKIQKYAEASAQRREGRSDERTEDELAKDDADRRKKLLIAKKITRLYVLENMQNFGLPGTLERENLKKEFEEIIGSLKYCKNKGSSDYENFCEFMVNECMKEEFIKMGIKSELVKSKAGDIREWLATHDQVKKARESVNEILEKYGMVSV